jgi:hypothetical protein
VREAPAGRLLRIKHDHRDVGCLSARLVNEYDCPGAWCLRVESPEDLDEFRRHLEHGSSMLLTLVTHDGRVYRGEACVSSVSTSADVCSLVVLAGVGPLLND